MFQNFKNSCFRIRKQELVHQLELALFSTDAIAIFPRLTQWIIICRKLTLRRRSLQLKESKVPEFSTVLEIFKNWAENE
jgi:hypothetical protein